MAHGLSADDVLSQSPVEPVAGNYFVAAYPPFSTWNRDHRPHLERAFDQPSRPHPLGLYVHLPFCQKKCDYCHYLSYIHQPASVVNRYLDALATELGIVSGHAAIKGRTLDFAYFGGGTPSMLNAGQVHGLMANLRKRLPWENIREVTYECAPRSVRPELLTALRACGVTRLSLGVQSLDDTLLKLNGRVHLRADVERAYQRIRQHAFDCVNLDLMVGLIGETPESWRDTVRRAIDLAPESITVYQTEIPYNTKLYREFKEGTLPAEPISWDLKRARLECGFELLQRAGYQLASAYHAVRDPGRHPFLYQQLQWRGADLLCLGVAAFGYFRGVHYQNQTTLESYLHDVEAGRLPLHRARALTDHEQLTREFILQFKLGFVPRQPFLQRYGRDVLKVFAQPLRVMETEGWLFCTPEGVQLTMAGLLKADRLVPAFYDPKFRGTRYT